MAMQVADAKVSEKKFNDTAIKGIIFNRKKFRMGQMRNVILDTDSYKLSHFLQLPQGTTKLVSYIESRGGLFDETVFFGLQKALIDLEENFPTIEDVEEAEYFAEKHGEPFNKQGWLDLIELGYYPLFIRAIPEGQRVRNKNALMSITNTDDRFAWLVSYFETVLLRTVWYMTTVATLSFEIKQIIGKAMWASSDNSDDMLFRLCDFGGRGVSSEESAGMGSASFLINFWGTDTISGVRYAMYYYNSDVCGFSIPASEHSTVTIWGRDGEKNAYSNMLKQFPTGAVACVMDSYDPFRAAREYIGSDLRQQIVERDGVFVFRPDSGDPLEVIPVLLNILGNAFGYTENSKGYKVLHKSIRLIWGDGIDQNSIKAILNKMLSLGWSAENISFGMGGALLQGVTRDTQKFAMKASAALVNGKWVEIYKDPITDSGKMSKRGIQMYIVNSTKTVDIEEFMAMNDNPDMPVVFNNRLVRRYDFDEVRNRTNGCWEEALGLASAA